MTHQSSSSRRRSAAGKRLLKAAVAVAVCVEVFLITIAASEAAYVHWQWKKSAEVAELGAALAVAQAARDTGIRPANLECAVMSSVDGITGAPTTQAADATQATGAETGAETATKATAAETGAETAAETGAVTPRWFGALVARLKAELHHIAPEHVTLTLSGDGPCLTADVRLAGMRFDFILLDVLAEKFGRIPLPAREAAATAQEVLVRTSVA